MFVQLSTLWGVLDQAWTPAWPRDLQKTLGIVKQTYKRCIVFNLIENYSDIEGVPVFCTNYCPAHPISFKFADINNTRMLSIEPDRQGWFNALAYHQFSRHEMRNGTAWNIIREHQ